MAKTHGIPDDFVFASWEECASKEKVSFIYIHKYIHFIFSWILFSIR